MRIDVSHRSATTVASR